ncbi:MAG: MFS transporter, partial [Acidimicrobiales bacterium]
MTGLSPADRPTSTRLSVLTLAVVVSTAAALPAFLVGAVAVQLRHSLAFGPTALGGAIAVYFAAAAVASVPCGRLADRAGAPRVMQMAAAGSALALGGIAAGARSWAELVGALAVAGVASAAAQPAVNLFLSEAVTGAQGLAFGIKQAAVPLATLLSGLAVPAIALTVGWRWAFAGGAALAAVGVLLAGGVAGPAAPTPAAPTPAAPPRPAPRRRPPGG